jgi:hypothetical protein
MVLVIFSGHFSNKFPHKKNKGNDEDYSNRKQTYKGKIKTKKVFKKKLNTKEEISSSCVLFGLPTK